MKLKIPFYDGKYRVVSLALDEPTARDLMKENVEFIYAVQNETVLYPEKWILTDDTEIIARLRNCNNYDVFEILEDGTLCRVYDDSSEENTFFITEKCNSGCIMCPSPEYFRRRGNTVNIDDLISIAGHIPSDVPHITITGGEPFMAGKELFRLLGYCREKFENTEFQILTNGRIFAVNEYCEMLRESIPNNTTIGIPLHGSREKTHDMITRTDNSFRQTITGLRRLLRLGIQVEIRIVVCKLNAGDLRNIAQLIVTDMKKVHHVSIMAMEMTGSAFRNADMVWIPYRESFAFVRPAIETLIRAGIDVRLYNFPLCTVDHDYGTLCARSISGRKVRYADVCEKCSLRESCGGVFAGTLRLERGELEAIL